MSQSANVKPPPNTGTTSLNAADAQFPSHYYQFPRRSWFLGSGPLPLPIGATDLKLLWAGRGASLRWKKALETADIGDVDAVDFILAVFDLAERFNQGLPDLLSCFRFRFPTLKAWTESTDLLILDSYDIACETVEVAFPDFAIPPVEEVQPFVRNALNWSWTEDRDCIERKAPETQAIDEHKWTDRYIPDPDLMWLTCYTVVDADDEKDETDEEANRNARFNFYDHEGKFVRTMIGLDNATHFLEEDRNRRSAEWSKRWKERNESLVKASP